MERVQCQQRRYITAICAVLMVIVAGCQDQCSEPPPEGMEGAYELSKVVPGDADAVVFSERLDELVTVLDAAGDQTPLSLEAVGDIDDWEGIGAWGDGPAVATIRDGQWSMVAWADADRDTDLDQWITDTEPAALDFDDRRLAGRHWLPEEGDVETWVSSDGRRIAVGSMTEPDGVPWAQRMWSTGDEHWQVDAYLERTRQGFDESNEGRRAPSIVGAIDGPSVVGQLQGQGRAGYLIDELAAQIGTVYWTLDYADGAGPVSIELMTPGRADLPSAVDDLGEARATLPDLGGLLKPGAPGVVRLSVQPERLVELLRSTLDVHERQQFDMALDMLRDQLSIDLREDLIANLTGQFAVVVFGIEDSFFEDEGLDRVAQTAAMETTREAVLVPFEEREGIESVLNALTQLSRGRLQREAGEHTIQYAWFDDGVLEWAVILSDDELAFVDTMVANEHIQQWMRSPQPLGGIFEERGVESMLGARRGMGAYLDVATIRTMLDEGGAGEAAQWLEAVDALQLETDIDGRPEQSRIELWLDDDVQAGE